MIHFCSATSVADGIQCAAVSCQDAWTKPATCMCPSIQTQKQPHIMPSREMTGLRLNGARQLYPETRSVKLQALAMTHILLVNLTSYGYKGLRYWAIMVLSACVVAARLYLFDSVENCCQESSNCCNRDLAARREQNCMGGHGDTLSTNRHLH